MLDEALEEINDISLKVKDFPALHRLLAEIYLHRKTLAVPLRSLRGRLS